MNGFLRRNKSAPREETIRIELPSQVPPYPLLDTYEVKPYEVRISDIAGKHYYSAALSSEATSQLERASKVLQVLETEQWTPPVKPANLGDLLFQLKARLAPALASEAVSSALEMSEVLAYQFVGLPSMFPFFKDDLVDELYLDSPHSTLYLDHRKLGRCDTFVFMSNRELKALETHLEMFCGESPSLERPTIKGELQIAGLRLRVGIDTPPLSLNGESVHIRKLGAKPFTLPQLVLDGTLGLEEAAFLGACLVGSVNITIVGPSGSGKTSLLNALDIAAPPDYRRIYIEDAVESLDLAALGVHQTKLRVPPLESELDGGAMKSLEVLKSLHKTPDLLVLGEIQSEGHSRALFQALSSGIKGLQTYHASGPEQAVRRWTQLHGIAPVQLADLGVIVTMIRPSSLSSKRYVIRVSQVSCSGDVQDVYSTAPPFEGPRRAMEISSTKASLECDSVRGSGWFAETYSSCLRRLQKAIDLGATDVPGFIGTYWDRSEMNQHGINS